jgi:hypothetical protein
MLLGRVGKARAPAVGGLQVARECLCDVVRCVRVLCLGHVDDDGLICVGLIGAESVSASCLWVGGGVNGCGGCGDGGLSWAPRETVLDAMSELVRALLGSWSM